MPPRSKPCSGTSTSPCFRWRPSSSCPGSIATASCTWRSCRNGRTWNSGSIRCKTNQQNAQMSSGGPLSICCGVNVLSGDILSREDMINAWNWRGKKPLIWHHSASLHPEFSSWSCGVQPGWSITAPKGRGFRRVLSCPPLPLFNRFVVLKLAPAVSDESVVVRCLHHLRRPPPSPTS